MEKENEFFIYDHKEREFKHVTDKQKKKQLEQKAKSGSVKELEQSITDMGLDGLLILDVDNSKWVLCFGEHLGIVGQRTARRQADSIARSGYNVGKYRIRANYPLEELSDANIGDLWKTVQQKYVKSSLSGLELDESGIPSQIAERAKILTSVGIEDELTKAEQERREAEARKRAMAKSGEIPPEADAGTEKKTKPKKKSTKKKATKKKASVAVEETAEEPSEEERELAVKKKAKKIKDGPFFYEIKSVREYIEDNNTVFAMKGILHKDDEELEDTTVVFKKQFLKENEWNKTVIYLKKEDIVQIDLLELEDTYFAGSVQK